jgi:cytidine deaminase
MALSASSSNHTVMTPIPPCGACRQSISEYEIKQEAPIEIYFMGQTGKVVKVSSLSDLLPLAFDKSYL